MTSEHKGIYFDKNRNKWIARITINNKNNFIGKFNTEKEAIKVYLKFIKDNENILPDRAKNLIKINESLPRDINGYIDRVCIDCGKISKHKIYPTAKKCKSCSNKKRFKNYPIPYAKYIGDINKIAIEYYTGLTLNELGKKYNVSGTTIKNKLIKFNYKIKTHKEASPKGIKKKQWLTKMSKSLTKFYSNIEERKKISARKQGIPIEKWEKFLKPENLKLWNRTEYRQWRYSIIRRDNFVCSLCGLKNKKLTAHHILTKAKRPDLIFDINNGIALCKICHFCRVNNHEKEYEQFFLDILKVKQTSQISV